MAPKGKANTSFMLLNLFCNSKLFFEGCHEGVLSDHTNQLGLCMGISALSALEFLYFFTLRLFFNVTVPREEI